jgi:hypothetical protein
MPSKVTPGQVDRLIRHEDFSVFHSLIKKELDIENIEYDIAYEEQAEDKDGYDNNRTNARTKFEENWEGVEKITFFGESLSNNINLKFSKLPRQAFLAAVEICIRFALVHELVHVQQFKTGVLTKEKMKELQQIPYEERDVEIEANNLAKEILSRYGNYDTRVLEILTSNESLDNENLPQFLDHFEKQ